MFLNLKYHIVSLVAVFLALGLGILIGSAFPGDTTLISQQQQLVGRLESRIESIRQKNESLRARINQLEMDRDIRGQFELQVLPTLVEGKLRGRSVAILATGGHVTEDLAVTLQLAGATIQSSTILEEALKNREEVLKKLDWPDMDQKSFLSRVAGEISSAVMSGETRTTKILAGEGVLKISGRYGGTVSDVVIVGGNNRIEKGMDSHFIDFFTNRGISVFGAEESFAAYSCMKDYQKKGLATVDNIDTVPGQVSLVYAMSGRPGHYGIKSTARSLLPVIGEGVEANAR
ncbi:MAG: copper transporter [Bacillota bacterium]